MGIKFFYHLIEESLIFIFLPLILYYAKDKFKIQQEFKLQDYYLIFGLIMFTILGQFCMYQFAENYPHKKVVEIKETKIDKMIPKISETVYIYDMLYAVGLFAGLLSIKNYKQLSYVLFFIILLNLILFAIYMLYPTKLDEKSRDKNEKNELLKEIQEMDTIGNAFPSTHVTIAVFITCLLYPVFKNWSILYLLLNVVTCLTTKQHYLPDILSALVLGGVYSYLIKFVFDKKNF